MSLARIACLSATCLVFCSCRTIDMPGATADRALDIALDAALRLAEPAADDARAPQSTTTDHGPATLETNGIDDSTAPEAAVPVIVSRSLSNVGDNAHQSSARTYWVNGAASTTPSEITAEMPSLPTSVTTPGQTPSEQPAAPSSAGANNWPLDQPVPTCPHCQQPGDCGCGSGSGPDGWRPEGVTGPWPPDEYLCDGGDQETRVAVGRDWTVYGLDLEDTVAHYDTLDGQTVVTPSNSVCIYAPRFSAVRRVVQTSEDGLLLAMQTVEQPLPAITEEGADQPTRIDQPLLPQPEVALRGPLGLRHRTRGTELLVALPVHELVKDFAVHEDFQVIRLGIHQTSERAEVERYSVAAVQWTDALAPEVMLEQEPAQIDVTVEKIGTEYHLAPEGSPRLRVIKLASCCSALPGEEITFTLRFDNTGEQTIGNVTILDNLTTRLEYVPDSAQCSLKADFFHDQNQGESLSLRWEIREPIRPGEGGIIRFRCKVR
jgi:uncharacterized repeat protein (TIGR01451 family)